MKSFFTVTAFTLLSSISAHAAAVDIAKLAGHYTGTTHVQGGQSCDVEVKVVRGKLILTIASGGETVTQAGSVRAVNWQLNLPTEDPSYRQATFTESHPAKPLRPVWYGLGFITLQRTADLRIAQGAADPRDNGLKMASIVEQSNGDLITNPVTIYQQCAFLTKTR